jgi:molecular chaperone GrpE
MKDSGEAMTRVRDAFTRWSRKGHEGESNMNTETLQNDPMADGAQVDLVAGTETGQPVKDDAAQVEIEALRAENDQLKDRLARSQAEFDNARKREVKERQDARDYAVQGAVEPFLSVMDNFQLALKADGSAEQLRTGVELILKQMEDALRGLNVQAVESVGSQFDPRIHEALGSIETVEHPDHEVLEEIRRGYKLRDKLLRPALVRIAVNPAQVSE